MDGEVVAAVLLAAVLHATWNALVRGRTGDPLASSVGLSLCWAAVCWPLVWATGPLPGPAWAPLLGSVAVHVFYFSFLTAAYRSGELSLVYPIARGVPPVLVALGSAALGERLSATGTAGIGLVALGILSLGVGGRAGARAVGLAVGSAVCTALYTLLDGNGVRLADDSWSYSARLLALEGTVFGALALALGGRTLAAAAWEVRSTAAIGGVLAAGGYAIALWAMTRAPVAAVAALRETSVLFGAVIGAVFLGEGFGPRRIGAAALVAAGAILVRSG